MKLLEIVNNVSARQSFRMAFLTNFIREPTLRRLEAEHGLIRPEWTVLTCLNYYDGATARDICEVTEQPRNTISRGVIALESKDLVRREPDPDDARRTCVWLTEAGRRMYRHMAEHFERIEHAMLSQLEAHEREALDRILTKLCLTLPDWLVERPAVVAVRADGLMAKAPADSERLSPGSY
ncbi:MAG: MarR family winged helix-turn-helix transcriptional regulator [Burkholderiaceae bacterium]